MGRFRVEIDLAAPGAGRHAPDLARGGLFLPGEELALDQECEIELRGGEEAIEVVARVVFADGHGVGLDLGLEVAVRTRLVALALAAPPADAGGAGPPPDTVEPAATDDAADAAVPGAHEPAERERGPKNVHERLRGLNLVAQYKVARHGELHERVALERLYHKAVWEQLLRNPRITPPEVARIARMGNLPRPQLEQILANPTWLGVPEIRRALLATPRLGADQILRVLRLLPRHELKLVPIQVAYPLAVREAARRLLQTPI